MYQGSPCSAFDVKPNLLFSIIPHLFLKQSPSFWKKEDYALMIASSSEGISVLFPKRENPDLNIFDSLFLNAFSLNYPVEEFLEQRFFQSRRNYRSIFCVKTKVFFWATCSFLTIRNNPNFVWQFFLIHLHPARQLIQREARRVRIPDLFDDSTYNMLTTTFNRYLKWLEAHEIYASFFILFW